MTNFADNWDIIGHEWAVEMLSGRLAAGRVSHATLITGLEGIGKSLLALRLAQAVNCLETPPPCGGCRPCDLIGREQHPDVLHIVPEGRTIRIEVMRELQGFLSMRPFEARWRVAVIQQVDRATGPAMDALLKTLEEPPATSKLILTAEAAAGLLPTMVSRCQVIALRPVPTAQIAGALAALHNVPPAEADLLARLSGGRPGWAIGAAADPQALARRDQDLDALVQVLASSRLDRFTYAENLAREDTLQSDVLNTWLVWWRDVLLVAEGSGVAPVNVDRLASLEEIAARVGPDGARQALRAVSETIALIQNTNVSTRLALEVMLLEIPYL